MKKTEKIKDDYGKKKFISQLEYEAIKIIDNGGNPNNKINKNTYKTVVKEYKRHYNLLIIWFIKKYPRLRTNIAKILKVNKSIDIISSKLKNIRWKKIENIYMICLEYSRKNKTRKK